LKLRSYSMSETRQPVKQGSLTDPHGLRRRRYAKGLSLTEAATRAGCTKSMLSKLEHGVTGASPPLLARLAGVYGCEITDLMAAAA
jgi:transcriptional regulator with XRE-family HTH domain